MDLSISYLGLELPHPLMAGASPLADELDTVRRLEDAGAAAIVLRSLFEEQIEGDARGATAFIEAHSDSNPEAQTFFPATDDFALGPDEYLEHVRRVKRAVDMPVIGSLNGVTPGGWLDYARLIEEAGADALELNLYHLATDPVDTSDAIERRFIEIVSEVKRTVQIPVAVKLSPFFTSLSHFAAELTSSGADGLVLFNRFYQPDIDVEELEVNRTLALSSPLELRLRLRWLAILSGTVGASLAVSGGVHTALDAVKSVMAGASGVQMVSALLSRGPEHLRSVRDGVAAWLEEHEYESLRQMLGSMNLSRCPDPLAYERANYMYILQTWRA